MTSLTISSTCPDAALSAAVAEHCAGWRHVPSGDRDTGNGLMAFPEFWRREDGSGDVFEIDELPPFATSVDECLPILETYPSYRMLRVDTVGESKWMVEIDAKNLWGLIFRANGPTAARTLCYALLKSKGFEVTP